MAEVKKRRHFAKEWHNHSVSETSKSTRNASLGLAAGVGVLTGLVNWMRSWHSGHPLSPWGLIWPGLAVAGIVLLALFLFHFFAAPFRMAGHAHKNHEVDLATAEKDHQADLLRVQQSHLDMERKLQTAKRDVHSRDAQIAALQREPVSPEHLGQIKRVCKSLAGTVAAGGRSKYDDPESALSNDPRTRAALQVHCPDVVSFCDEWDDILGQVDAGLESLEEKIEREVEPRFIGSPWVKEWIGPICLERVKAWARMPNESIPPMRLSQWDSRSGNSAPGTGDVAMWNSYAVLIKEGGLSADEVRDAEDNLNRFVDAAVQWDESTFLSALYAEQLDRQRPAQVEALRVLDTHSIPRNEGCPLC